MMTDKDSRMIHGECHGTDNHRSDKALDLARHLNHDWG